MNKLTNEKLQYWLKRFWHGWKQHLFPYGKPLKGNVGKADYDEGKRAHVQLLTLIDSQEQPKDGDVENALKYLDPMDETFDDAQADFIDHIQETIRKALIHYGNMPKKAYRYNEKLTNKETT